MIIIEWAQEWVRRNSTLQIFIGIMWWLFVLYGVFVGGRQIQRDVEEENQR